jgi:hypothetical protein
MWCTLCRLHHQGNTAHSRPYYYRSQFVQSSLQRLPTGTCVLKAVCSKLCAQSCVLNTVPELNSSGLCAWLVLCMVP